MLLGRVDIKAIVCTGDGDVAHQVDLAIEESVIKAMRAFGISLIPWAVFRLCVGSTAGVAILLLAFVIFLLVKIFKYGAELQQESDETL